MSSEGGVFSKQSNKSSGKLCVCGGGGGGGGGNWCLICRFLMNEEAASNHFYWRRKYKFHVEPFSFNLNF